MSKSYLAEQCTPETNSMIRRSVRTYIRRPNRVTVICHTVSLPYRYCWDVGLWIDGAELSYTCCCINVEDN